MLFDHAEFVGPGGAHEQIDFAACPRTGLRAILAIHSTARGPALGGCRIWRYAGEAEALTDVLRLSRGMSYKAALADLPLGGGKSVILLGEGQEKTPAMMRAMGRAVERLGGRYIAAEDVGATPSDMDEIARETRHVTGLSSGVGDPSPWTAEGVFLCIREAARLKLGREDLKGARIVVKGLGAVGSRLARLLAEEGAAVTLSDIDQDRAEKLSLALGGAPLIAPEAAIRQSADVFAPCALGGDLDAEGVEALASPIVCGAANNQLGAPADGARLAARGVLYCPDYLVNAGGLISVARRPIGMDEKAARAKLMALPDTLREVVARAAAEGDGAGASAAAMADRLAEARFKGE